jgi:simple sugar transport system permease protein
MNFSMNAILEKREVPHGGIAKLLLVLFSIIFGFVIGAWLIALAGVSPLEAYQSLFYGAFGRKSGVIEFILKGTPLLLAGLGMVIAFKAQVWNIGGEGQIYVGAMAATWVGINFAGLPTWLHLPLTILAGGIGGSLWALIPAILRVFLNVNEVITTLMFNYIGIFIVSWAVHGPMKEPGGFMPQTARIAETAILPPVIPATRLHAGVLLALIAAVAVYFLLYHTTIGYNIRAVGENPQGAKFGGIRVGGTLITAMLMSGFLCGLAGTNEVLGSHYRLLDGISPGYGFTAIVVALLGRLNPFGVIAAAYLFSSLFIGATQMQRTVQIPLALSNVIQAIIVLTVLGTERLLNYDIVPLRKLISKVRRNIPAVTSLEG